MKVEREFKKTGLTITMKTKVEDTELDSKGVLDTILNFEKAIEQIGQQREQLKKRLEELDVAEEENKLELSKLSHYKDWAKDIQISKAKAIAEEELENARLKVELNYKFDKTMTEEQNNLQKYAQFQRYVATSERARNELSADIIKKHYFEESLIKNIFQ